MAAYAVFAVFLVYVCAVCAWHRHIELCIKIMRNSGKFILNMKTVPFFPFNIYVAELGLLLGSRQAAPEVYRS